MDKVTVIQADREAAADAVLAIRGRKDGDWQGRIRKGECDDGTMCLAFATHRKAGEAERDRTAKRIAELIAEGDGSWSPCSGCQEGVDGYVSEKDYPFDPVFQCQPGGGCGECGGIGVIWHDRQYFASWDDFAPSDATPAPDSEKLREVAQEAIAGIDLQALASTIHDARWDQGQAASSWVPFTDEVGSGKVYSLRIANAVQMHLLAALGVTS